MDKKCPTMAMCLLPLDKGYLANLERREVEHGLRGLLIRGNYLL